MFNDLFPRWLHVLLIAIVAYVSISSLVYALRHPELTDTQRLIRIVEALTWQ